MELQQLSVPLFVCCIKRHFFAGGESLSVSPLAEVTTLRDNVNVLVLCMYVICMYVHIGVRVYYGNLPLVFWTCFDDCWILLTRDINIYILLWINVMNVCDLAAVKFVDEVRSPVKLRVGSRRSNCIPFDSRAHGYHSGASSCTIY